MGVRELLIRDLFPVVLVSRCTISPFSSMVLFDPSSSSSTISMIPLARRSLDLLEAFDIGVEDGTWARSPVVGVDREDIERSSNAFPRCQG